MSPVFTVESGKLAARIRSLKDGRRITLDDLTVLAPANDPYRVDTKAGHRDAAWFLEQFERAIGHRESLHLRGLHYAIVARGDVLKPNGQPYVNCDDDWSWLQACPAKAARWLGYVSFESIRDQRNDPPVIHRAEATEPAAWVSPGGLTFELPDADDIQPRVVATGFKGRQPYHLVIFGEKSSLAEIVMPIARRFHCDVYLPTGEITDTLLYRMASDGAGDGRPMQVFTLSDCDPAGYQMPVSIGRKLQALRDLEFHSLDFEVRPVCLAVEQVRDLGLPSTPLKETELRADRWRSAFGVEQTEIDALATLRPNVLRQIVEKALSPFFEASLERRVAAAESKWRAEAQRVLDESLDPEMLAHLRYRAEVLLADLREQTEAIEEKLRVEVPDGVNLPEIDVPEPEVCGIPPDEPLVSSRWNWLEQTAALKKRKAY